MNKRDLNYIKKYRESYIYSIYDCYEKPSINKVIAYDETRSYMESINGTGYRILSYNTFSFTCGFRVKNYLYVITKDNLYTIKLYD